LETLQENFDHSRLKRKKKQLSGMTACRICLGEENEAKNPLISPCLCSGSMKHIHVDCLKHWLNQKRTQRLGTKI